MIFFLHIFLREPCLNIPSTFGNGNMIWIFIHIYYYLFKFITLIRYSSETEKKTLINLFVGNNVTKTLFLKAALEMHHNTSLKMRESS